VKSIAPYIFDIKWVFRFLLILAIASLIPLLHIAQFTHPSADDFSYGSHTVGTWRTTASIPQTIGAAIDGTRYVYNNWQGSFVAVFLMTLHPAVFGEHLYFLGPIFIILGFVAATMFLLKVIFMDYFGADKYSYGIISMVFTFISVQFIFSPVEGFFWYNSAMYYTGFHSASLILFALALLWMKTDSPRAALAYCIAIPLLSFLVGGSNFVTALTSLLIMVLFFTYCLFIKRGKWLVPLIAAIAICTSLVIATIAPGNAVRQEHFQSMQPLLAIITSFEYGVTFIRLVIGAPIWFGFACIAPLIYKVARNSTFQFRYPPLVIAMLYGVYVSTFTPNLYSWSSFGPARVVNMNLFAFLFFFLFSIVYLAGYLSKKVKPVPTSRSKKKYRKSTTKSSFKEDLFIHPAFAGVMAICFTIACISVSFANVNSMASISATRSLVTGEARIFHYENLARREYLRDPEILHIEFHELTVAPHSLFFMDIEPDPTMWVNTAIAQFYNKDSVVLIPSSLEY